MRPDIDSLVRRRDGGRSVWWSRGSIVTVWFGAEETEGSFALAEQFCPPGYETPLHVHNDHDEALFAPDGEFDMYYDDERVPIERGELAYFPKGIAHGFRNTEDRMARLWIAFEPGLERGFLEAGIPVETPTDGLPDPPEEIADAEKLIDVDEVYDTEIVESLPDS
jgi:mannose-6-phosphate isomerase-like protein (cupin superfamily)